MLQRFLARVFADPTGPWILKGGTGLLVRLPGARYSEDIDLVHPTVTLPAAIDELHALCGPVDLDPLTYRIGDATRMTGAALGARLNLTAYLGTTRVDRFRLDLTVEPHLVAAVEHYHPRLVIDIDIADTTPPPPITLYPLPDQMADKVGAMGEHHRNGSASTRYRDLVDLVLIVTQCAIDAASTRQALITQHDRRNLTLPGSLVSPADHWVDGYHHIARSNRVEPTRLYDALAVVGACLDPLLQNTIRTGTWNPTTHTRDPTARASSPR